jgi:hypothetical protein
MGWTWGDKKTVQNFIRKPSRRDNFGDLGVDKRVILKWIKQDVDLVQLDRGRVHWRVLVIKLLSSIKGADYLYQLSDCQYLKMAILRKVSVICCGYVVRCKCSLFECSGLSNRT